MAPTEAIEDPLGFTRETAALLTGLGCSNLEQFQKRNVSLEDLKHLTDEDLLLLDVGEEFDRTSFKRLIDNLNRKYVKKKPKIQDIFAMIKINQSQLELLNLYLKYAYAQLALHKQEDFIDVNKNMKVSQALSVACNSVLQEVKDLEEAIAAMQISSNPKCVSKKKKFYIVIASAVGVLALILYIKK